MYNKVNKFILLLEYGPSSSSFPLPCSSLSYFPCRLALNSKYKLETITVDKMLTLKFTFKFNPQKCPLPMILLKSHTRQRENKILWCPSEGEKKTTTDYILSVSLSCLYGINHWNAPNLYIYTDTYLLHPGRKSPAETQMHPPRHILLLEDLKLLRVVSLRQLWAAHSQSFILSFIQKTDCSDCLRQWFPVRGPTPVGLVLPRLENYCFLLISGAKLRLEVIIIAHCFNQRW